MIGKNITKIKELLCMRVAAINGTIAAIFLRLYNKLTDKNTIDIAASCLTALKLTGKITNKYSR